MLREEAVKEEPKLKSLSASQLDDSLIEHWRQKVRSWPNFGLFSVELENKLMAWFRRQRSQGTVRDLSYALLSLLNHVDRDKVFAGELRTDYKSVSPDAWGHLVLDLASVYKGKTEWASRTRASKISGLNSALRFLQESLLMPRLGMKYKIKTLPYSTLEKPTLLAWADDRATPQTPTEVLADAQEQLQRVMTRCAEIVREAKARLAETERIISSPVVDADSLVRQFDSCVNWADVRDLVQGQVGKNRIILYVHHKYGGVLPQGITKVRPFGWSFHHDNSDIHTVEGVNACFALSAKELAAAALIFAVEGLVNPEDIRRLTTASLSEHEDPKVKLLTVEKWRAGEERRDVEVEVDHPEYPIAIPEVVEILRCHQARLASHASKAESDRLFLHAFRTGSRKLVGADAVVIFGPTLSSHSKKIGESVGLKGLTLKAARSLAASAYVLRGESILDVRDAMGHASAKTTLQYMDQVVMHARHGESIRKFLEELQYIVLHPDQGMAVRAGLDAPAHELAKERADKYAPKIFKGFGAQDDSTVESSPIDLAQLTGTGSLCSNPTGGAQAKRGFPKGTPCGALDRCFECENFTPYVVVTPENINFLLSFRRHLLDGQERLLQTKPKRWQNTWLPWLAFVEVALETLSGPKYSIAMKEGERLSAESPITFMELW